MVDDFYTDPDAVRALALSLNYHADERWFKGRRSAPHLFPWVREEFARLLGTRITAWTEHRHNGVFQITVPDDPTVYHADTQSYAGAIYLTPPQCPGTCFWRHATGASQMPADVADADYTDRSRWTPLGEVAGLYNRLVLWRANQFHSAAPYDAERLVQLFFFDI